MLAIKNLIRPIQHLIMKKKWLIIIVLVIGIGIWFYYRSVTKEQAKNAPYIVKKQNLKDTLSFSGSIDAEEHTILKFQSSGQIAWVGVKEGDQVKKYQAIASLDQRTLEKNIQKYLNTYVKERRTFDQSEDDNLDTSLVGSTRELRDAARRLLDESQADLNNSVLDLEIQTLAKQYATLISPIDGIVIKANPEQSGVNTTTDTAYEIVNPSSIFFSASADQTDVVKIQQGMPGEIILDAYPDQKMRGVITSIGYTPKSGETDTVYELKINFDKALLGEYAYRLGMTGDVEFVLKERPNTLAIPDQYFKTEGNDKYVYKLVGNEKKKTKVETGDEIDGSIEITAGLQEGDTIYEFPVK